MKILLAVDESPYSTEAVGTIGARTWPLGTAVRVLTVVESLPPPVVEVWPGGNLEQVQQELLKRAAALTARAVEALRIGGLVAEPMIREGDPRTVIVREANDWPADLIALGSHGSTSVTPLVLGSVAQSVVNGAPCSVEVVRQKRAESEEVKGV